MIKYLVFIILVLPNIATENLPAAPENKASNSFVCGGKNNINYISVNMRGTGEFRRVQDAIDSIKNNNDQWVKIGIEPGVYKEKVTIPPNKPCIILQGRRKDNTIISYSDHANGKTDENATFTSWPSNVIVRNIGFQNTYNVEKISRKYYIFRNFGRDQIKQAVAARIYGDKTYFYKCSFTGYQDTLFDSKGRHYFESCLIEGEIDFIFGNGQSYYKDCVIHTLGIDNNNPGFITAQGRELPEDPTGFVFKGGKVQGRGKVNLGRAWRNFSRVIFDETNLSEVVTPHAWNAWNATGQEEKLTYAEINYKGRGADTSQRVKWLKKLDKIQAEEFSKKSFINKDGWLEKLPQIT